MRLLFDATSISNRNSGVGHVTQSILREVSKSKNIDIIAYTRKGIKQLPYPQIVIKEMKYSYGFFGWKRFFTEQIILPKLIKKYHPDIIHFPSGFGVPFLFCKIPSNIKVITTIHDIIPITKYWELMSICDRFFYRISLKQTLKRANKIVAISQYTAKDILTTCQINKEVNIIPDGIESNIYPQMDVKKELNINKDYILYVGGFSKRKNLLNLIIGYSQLSQNIRDKYKLILTGKIKGNLYIEKEVIHLKNVTKELNLSSSIYFFDFVDMTTKYNLIKNAAVFIYPSLYEGFGLPILEALIQKVPIITTVNSSMEEISKPYGLYVNTSNAQEISKGIITVLNNLSYWQNKASDSVEKIKNNYNWEVIGQKYIDLYLK